jgi:hypothetical protein
MEFWHSDTCGCHFSFERLPAQAADPRGAHYDKVTALRTCLWHMQPDPKDRMMAALRNNWRRNDARRVVAGVLGLEADPERYSKIRIGTVVSDGSRTIEGPRATEVWEVRFAGITVSTRSKDDIQAALDIQFGPGLVQVV